MMGVCPAGPAVSQEGGEAGRAGRWALCCNIQTCELKDNGLLVAYQVVSHFRISLDSWAMVQGEVRGSDVSPMGVLRPRETQGLAEDNTAREWQGRVSSPKCLLLPPLPLRYFLIPEFSLSLPALGLRCL